MFIAVQDELVLQVIRNEGHEVCDDLDFPKCRQIAAAEDNRATVISMTSFESHQSLPSPRDQLMLERLNRELGTSSKTRL